MDIWFTRTCPAIEISSRSCTNPPRLRPVIIDWSDDKKGVFYAHYDWLLHARIFSTQNASIWPSESPLSRLFKACPGQPSGHRGTVIFQNGPHHNQTAGFSLPNNFLLSLFLSLKAPHRSFPPPLLGYAPTENNTRLHYHLSRILDCESTTSWHRIRAYSEKFTTVLKELFDRRHFPSTTRVGAAANARHSFVNEHGRLPPDFHPFTRRRRWGEREWLLRRENNTKRSTL